MKPRSNPFLRSALAAAALAATSATATAATISWSTPTSLTGTSDVFNVGSFNYGYTESDASTTVNGVTFAAGNSTTSLGGGNVTMTGFTGGVDTTGYNDGHFSGAYATLIQGGAWSSSAGSATVTLNNFSTGHVYATQFWVADYRSFTNARTESLDSAVTLGYLTGNGNPSSGTGQYAIGRFTADATSQIINITANESAQMNAIQVRDITGVWNGAASTNLNSGDANFEGGSYATISGLAAPVTSLYFADTDGFGNSMASKNSITVDAAGFSAGSLNFQNNGVNYTLQNASGTTGITGATALTKAGSGTLTLTGVNSYTGGTVVNEGKLILDNGSSNDGYGRISGALTVNSNGTVELVTSGNDSGFGWNGQMASIAINGGTITSGSGVLNHIWNISGGVTMTGGTLQSNGGVSDAAGARLEWGNTALTTLASANTATIAGRINIRADASNNLTFTVADGDAATDLLVSAAITQSNTAGITKAGAGTMVLSGVNSYTGGTSVNEGTLKLDLGARSGNDALGTFAVANGATLIMDNTNTTVGGYYPQNVVLSGAGTVTKTGVGSIDFWNGSSLTGFTGTMDVQQGALRLNNIGTNANMSQATLNIASGATFDIRYNASLSVDKLIGSGTLDQSYNGGSGLSVTVGANNGSSTFDGVIQNSSGQPLSLTKAGSGTFTLSGANSYSGNTTVSAGTLRLENTAALGSGTLSMASGTTLQLRSDNDATFVGGNGLGGVGQASVTFDVNQLTNGNSNKTIGFAPGGFETWETTINVTGGNGYTLALGSVTKGHLGYLNLNANSANLTIGDIGSAEAVGSLSVGGDANTTITGAISTYNGGGLSKSGNGVLTLSGNSSYSGATSVSAGKLIVNGDNSGATGAVTVASGATLGGNGTVGGATTIQSGGHLAVGNSPGKQTFGSHLTFDAGSIFDWELASNTTTQGEGTEASPYTFDHATVGGDLSINETAETGSIFKIILGTAFNGADAFWLANQSWNVFTVTGDKSTDFSIFKMYNASAPNTEVSYSSFGSFSYGYTGNTGTLTWTAVPEPTSALAGLLIAAGLLRRRREEREEGTAYV